MIRPMALATGSGGPFNDRHDFLVVNDWARHTGWLHGVARLYANDGVALFALLLLAGWWVARRRGDHRAMAAALWAGIGTLVTVAVNQPIANAVARNRPYVTLHHTLLLVHRSTDYTFPSDHACMAGAVATGVWLVSRRLGLVAVVAALLMAFTRVYVGAHYPATCSRVWRSASWWWPSAISWLSRCSSAWSTRSPRRRYGRWSRLGSAAGLEHSHR